MVPPNRIELSTSPLPRARSTTELRRQIGGDHAAGPQSRQQTNSNWKRYWQPQVAGPISNSGRLEATAGCFDNRRAHFVKKGPTFEDMQNLADEFLRGLCFHAPPERR